MRDKKIICRSMEWTEEDILKAIKEGGIIIDGVKMRITAGMGLCHGKTCERIVAKIIGVNDDENISDLLPARKRMSVRPLKISIMSMEEDDECYEDEEE